LERNDVSNFEKEAEAGVEKEDSDPNEGCDVVCSIGITKIIQA
jgi:hypothetical protein